MHSSPSKRSITAVLRLAAILAATSIAEGRTSDAPKRHRDENEFGRTRRPRAHQQRERGPNDAERPRRLAKESFSGPLNQLEHDRSRKTPLLPLEQPEFERQSEMSLPLEQSEFDMSLPLRQSEMSLPLEQSEFDMSAPLERSEFEMSAPLRRSEFEMSAPLARSEMSAPLEESEMSMPPEEPESSAPAGDGSADGLAGAVALESEGESGGSAVVLASFLAGLSALLVGAAALLVGMARRRRAARESTGAGVEAGGGREDASSPPRMREVDIA